MGPMYIETPYTNRIFSQDIEIEFEIEKWTVIVMNKGRRETRNRTTQ